MHTYYIHVDGQKGLYKQRRGLKNRAEAKDMKVDRMLRAGISTRKWLHALPNLFTMWNLFATIK